MAKLQWQRLNGTLNSGDLLEIAESAFGTFVITDHTEGDSGEMCLFHPVYSPKGAIVRASDIGEYGVIKERADIIRAELHVKMTDAARPKFFTDDDEEEDEDAEMPLPQPPKKPAGVPVKLAVTRLQKTLDAATSLMTKEHEPMIVRKYTQMGFPLYISLICGANLDNLDELILGFCKQNKARIKSNSIQEKRNLCGEMTEMLVNAYGDKTEGVAVVWYVDKMMISSLYGDFMTHASCKEELQLYLNMMCHI